MRVAPRAGRSRKRGHDKERERYFLLGFRIQIAEHFYDLRLLPFLEPVIPQFPLVCVIPPGYDIFIDDDESCPGAGG